MSNNLKVKMQVLAKDIRQHYGLKSQTEIAEDVGVAQGTICNILSGRATGLSPEVVQKVTKKLGTEPKKYILNNVDSKKSPSATAIYILESEEKKNICFKAIYAYDLPTGITYIGKPRQGTLEDMCMIPTTEIAHRCLTGSESALEVLRAYYVCRANGSALNDLQTFTPNEILAKYKL